MKTQQGALRECLVSCGVAAVKPLIITAEQRELVGQAMKAMFAAGEWIIKSKPEATPEDAYRYVVGTNSFDLIQHWVLSTEEYKAKRKAGPSSAPVQTMKDKIDALTAAVASGLMTKEDAMAVVAKLVA